MPAIDVADEFETIQRLLAPLAHPEWGRGLTDDVALIPRRKGHDLVVTKDAMVEGVHFLPTDPLDTVAQKLLRANLSDLAAKGVEPFGYLLACHWSPRCGWPERKAFVQGLAEDQERFGVALLGGDTVSTPGPASFSITLMGWTPKGEIVGRGGAQPGDLVFVTGVIGDGWLGLRAATELLRLEPERQAAVIEQYRRPMPRTAFAPAIAAHATAALDVSDGLVADLGHLARQSGVRVDVRLETLPLSMAGQAWFDGRADPVHALAQLATGGDDYEVVFTARPGDESALRREAERHRLRLTCIGDVRAGEGVRVRYLGEDVPISRPGWVHS
ncbi:thiamine-phosphate kinase [Brevundimonas sp. A19_0]|uniref:thiamine-phosphate kinase n=1 Tax=Brevundimonas sp. A19_0 TaxID=2821087 RepID=UPI001ADAA3B2|nr:thiamine-phosphate kinase [Brevundimonas sp. A19_0]MBO9500819.1 thiamine-phosphate kinase [Brevundimonas sp. A19_0]